MNKALKKLNDSIRKSNEQFAAMSKAEKRVAIAQDVLAHIKAENIIPTTGLYIDLFEVECNRGREEELQDIFNNEVESCEACALGSMFYCTVKRFNKLKVGDVSSENWYKCGNNISIDQDGCHSYLKKFFTVSQMLLIENAFEGEGKNTIASEFRKYVCSKVGKFDRWMEIQNYEEVDSYMLEAIMKNIIHHNGTFKPRVLPKITKRKNGTFKIEY